MLITLIRDTFTPAETLGKLYIDRKYFCDTLEPPVVPNAQHPKGAIPEGWYKVQLTRSPKFGRLLPLLYYVPVHGGPAATCGGGESGSPEHFNAAERQSVCEGAERVGIRIHAGNNRDHTSGCILVGNGSWDADGSAAMSDKSEQSCLSDWHTIPALFNSRATEQELVKLLKPYQDARHEMYIEVTDTERYAVERMPQPASYEYRHS